MNKVLVTSALPYVNNIPHLGNIVGSTLSADVFTRFLRMMGFDVYFLCGSDEYGTSTEVKARKENMTCDAICTKYHELHKGIYNWFNIKFDIFGRTSTKTQTEITHEIFFDLYRKGHIEKREIEQMYCSKCDLHLADRFLQGFCYSEKCKGLKIVTNSDQCDLCGNLLDQFEFEEYWCSVCHEIPVKVKTKHLYLKLDDFRDDLKKYFLSNSTVKLTHNAIGITKSFLEKKLESRCITRDLKWGTSVPGVDDFKKYLFDKSISLENIDFVNLPNLDEFKGKVFYVWFDAPIGYLSILKDGAGEKWLDWLKCGQFIQFMAKDNVPFHTIIFPASLIGSNPEKFPLVTGISSTEYLNYEGQKFSKSKNIGIFGDDVMKISEKLNIDEDYWRYYLMRIRPENHDSSFNWWEFENIIRSELARKIGNLINRCMSMTYKYLNNSTEIIETNYDFNKLPDKCFKFFAELNKLVQNYVSNFTEFKIRDALLCAVAVSDLGNLFVNECEIWNVCREDPKKGECLLGCINYIVCVLLKLLSPFIPKKCELLGNNFICSVNISDLSISGSVKISNKNFEKPFRQLNESKKEILECIKDTCC